MKPATTTFRSLERQYSGAPGALPRGVAGLEQWYDRVRDTPLDRLPAADLARACRQELFTQEVVDAALTVLERHALAGDLYEGQLLAAVAGLPASFWTDHTTLGARLESIAATLPPELNSHDRAAIERAVRIVRLREAGAEAGARAAAAPADPMLRLLGYDRWANERVGASLESAQAALERGPGGAAAEAPALVKARQIWGHVQWARALWLWRLGVGAPPEGVDRFPAWSVERLVRESQELDGRWREFVEGLDGAGLERVVAYTTVEGRAVTSMVRDIVAHVVNHSSYHRGQVARLVAECGGEAAVTDFILFAREHPPAGVEPS